MRFVYTESAVKPDEIDATSSRSKVYIRKNIREVEKKLMDGETYTAWGYDEAVITHEQFASYSQALTLEKQAAMDETLAEILLNQMEG